MPSTPALPIEIRLPMRTAGNPPRANDSATKSQNAKNGSHAAKAMAQRVTALRIISLDSINRCRSRRTIDRDQRPVHRECRARSCERVTSSLTDAICSFAESDLGAIVARLIVAPEWVEKQAEPTPNTSKWTFIPLLGNAVGEGDPRDDEKRARKARFPDLGAGVEHRPGAGTDQHRPHLRAGGRRFGRGAPRRHRDGDAGADRSRQ